MHSFLTRDPPWPWLSIRRRQITTSLSWWRHRWRRGYHVAGTFNCPVLSLGLNAASIIYYKLPPSAGAPDSSYSNRAPSIILHQYRYQRLIAVYIYAPAAADLATYIPPTKKIKSKGIKWPNLIWVKYSPTCNLTNRKTLTFIHCIGFWQCFKTFLYVCMHHYISSIFCLPSIQSNLTFFNDRSVFWWSLS